MLSPSRAPRRFSLHIPDHPRVIDAADLRQETLPRLPSTPVVVPSGTDGHRKDNAAPWSSAPSPSRDIADSVAASYGTSIGTASPDAVALVAKRVRRLGAPRRVRRPSSRAHRRATRRGRVSGELTCDGGGGGRRRTPGHPSTGLHRASPDVGSSRRRVRARTGCGGRSRNDPAAIVRLHEVSLTLACLPTC